jgi:phage shock protein C
MFCPHCGNQSALQVSAQPIFCSSCGTAVASQTLAQTRVVRPRNPRMIAGVCSGLAIHYGWDVAVVRILFAVAACLTTGCAIFFYIAAWVLIPEAQYALPPSRSVNTNLTVA